MRLLSTSMILLVPLTGCYDGREEPPFPNLVSAAGSDGSEGAGADGSEGVGESGDGAAGESSGDGEALTAGESSGEGETGVDEEASTGATSGFGELDAEEVCARCGCIQWSATVASEAVLDASLTALPDGGALTATVTGAGLTLQRFGPDGAIAWTRAFSGAVKNAQAVAIGEEFIVVAGTLGTGLVLDPDNAVMLVSAGGEDGFVALLSDSSEGGVSWAAAFGDAADQRVGAVAVTGCSEGLTGCRIQLAGVHGGQLGVGPASDGGTYLFHSVLDAFVWDPAAAQTWRRATTPAGDEVPTLASAPDGTVTLIGTVRDADAGDVIARRIGPDEQELWSVRLEAPGEQAANAAAHAGDRLWLAGYAYGQADLGAGPFGVGDEGTAFIAGIDADGAVVVSRAVSGRLPGREALATTAAGTVVVTGFTNADIDLGGGVLEYAGGRDVLLGRFDAAGGYRCGALYGDGKVQEGLAAASAGGRSFVLARVAGAIDFGDGERSAPGESVVLAAFAE